MLLSSHFYQKIISSEPKRSQIKPNLPAFQNPKLVKAVPTLFYIYTKSGMLQETGIYSRLITFFIKFRKRKWYWTGTRPLKTKKKEFEPGDEKQNILCWSSTNATFTKATVLSSQIDRVLKFSTT